MESTKSTAYAFMIMIAGLAVIGHYGRASAEIAAPNGYEAGINNAANYGPAMRSAGYQPQYGLIQTGMMGVAQLEGNGGFGRPSAMPVFQIVQLQPAGNAMPSQASLDSTPRNMAGQQGPAAGTAMISGEPSVPQGMSVSPPAEPRMTGTLCEIKGVRVLTQSQETCAMAGGQPPIL